MRTQPSPRRPRRDSLGPTLQFWVVFHAKRTSGHYTKPLPGTCPGCAGAKTHGALAEQRTHIALAQGFWQATLYRTTKNRPDTEEDTPPQRCRNHLPLDPNQCPGHAVNKRIAILRPCERGTSAYRQDDGCIPHWGPRVEDSGAYPLSP